MCRQQLINGAAAEASAQISESTITRWDRLHSSCQRTCSPTRSKQESMSDRGMSHTVSASGMLPSSAAVSGWPSSRVKANRPPTDSAEEISRSSVSLSGKASIVSSSSTTSKGPAGTGGIEETSKRQGRSAARSRAISMALALESTPKYVQLSCAVMSRPGPATPQHRSSTETPGAMPARAAKDRISPASMKLS
jgi:hypothetical protein